jgi:hypothetical protein
MDLEKIPRMITPSPFLGSTKAGLTFEDWLSVKGKLTNTIVPGLNIGIIEVFLRIFPLRECCF